MFDGQVKTKQGKLGREKDSPSQTNIIDGRASTNHHQEEVQVRRQKDQEGLRRDLRPVGQQSCPKGDRPTKGSVMGLSFKKMF